MNKIAFILIIIVLINGVATALIKTLTSTVCMPHNMASEVK